MEQFLSLAALIEQHSNEGSPIAAMVGDREVHDPPVLADQPDFMEEQQRVDPAQIKVEVPATPAVCVLRCFEPEQCSLTHAIAPDDLAFALKPGDLALALHDEKSSLDRRRLGAAARSRFSLKGGDNLLRASFGH
jgi:hypothetical protein